MKHTIETAGVPIKLWAPLEEVEAEALNQLKNVAVLPWVFKHVAVMPDVHAGKGCTVGSVIAMKDALSPAAVGVDIGCGMGAMRTNLYLKDLPDNLEAIRHQIERDIPTGFNEHALEVPLRAEISVMTAAEQLWDEFKHLDPLVHNRFEKARKQLGTLGGGNHFIELCADEFDRVWMMLHSGSRNIGKELAEIHIARARDLIHNATIPDPDMAVFLAGTPEMADYRRDLLWAQRYAFLNRRVMFYLYEQALRRFFPFLRCDHPILCHHNYVSEETHFGETVTVTRKGAISARDGEYGIIPGSMGTRSYIVRGKGNADSFHSASHGAGRVMSRGKAKRTFTVADLEAQTAGVCCRKDREVLDEIPGAYKNIDKVIGNQADLVEVVEVLRPLLCVKG